MSKVRFLKSPNRNKMKLLILLLPLLIQWTPIFSQDIGTLFRDTPYSKFLEGGEKWFFDGNEDTHVKYVGEIRSGTPHGNGIMSHKGRKFYEGGFKNGDYSGKGSYTYKDGAKTIGEFEKGKLNGFGTYIWPKSSLGSCAREKYVGEFKNDEFANKGKLFFKNGQIFEGTFVNNLNFGKGTKTLPDGSKYVGIWFRKSEDTIPLWEIRGFDKDGKIILEISEGNGKGFYGFNFLCQSYDGEWKAGKKHGRGKKYISKNRLRHEGEYKNGEAHGQGTLYDSWGTYVGEFKDGYKHGQGIYYWADTYEVAGESHGEKMVGKYAKGIFVEGKIYDKEWNLNSTYLNGEWKTFREVLYFWKNTEWRGEWSIQGNEEKQPVYKGEVKKTDLSQVYFKPHGKGILYNGLHDWSSSDKRTNSELLLYPNVNFVPNAKYEGEFKNGFRNGQGIQTLASGTTWNGFFKNNIPVKVTIFDKNGKEVGKFIDGIAEYYE